MWAWGKPVLSPLNGLGTPRWEPLSQIYEELFQGSLFYPTGPCICPYDSTVLSRLLYVVLASFEIRKCESSNFVLLFQDVLATQGSVKFHMNFRMDFPMSSKTIGGCLTGPPWLCRSLGSGWQPNDVKSSHQWTRVPFHVLLSSSIRFGGV